MTDVTAGGTRPAPPAEIREQAAARPAFDLESADELIACTVCDALHEVREPPDGGRIRCVRCGSTLLRSAAHTLDTLLASAFAVVILVTSALFFPFLTVTASGFSSSASLVSTALAFSRGITAPLVIALTLLIFVVPVLRAALLTYALMPIRLGRPLLPGARAAFRVSSELKPWSMAEVFIIGVIVALVKIGGMAKVSLGPAFWELTLIVLIVALETSRLSEKTLWRMIEQRLRS